MFVEGRTEFDLKPTEEPGIFETEISLTYISKKGEVYKVPKGFKTDGYSKPAWTHPLVGGRFDDDLRPCTLHDYFCVEHNVSFKKANDLFYEAMRSVGINRFKAMVMRIAVEFNPGRW